ncbi:MAG: flagellar biosynthesis regulator FlaF [Pseudomonadota bacterium]
MHQVSYAEVVAESPNTERERERRALDRSIELLEQAEAIGPQSKEAIEALVFTGQLWLVLLEDLGSEENSLPKELRADLISIGIWILRESDEIRSGKSESLQPIIDISKTIRDGLK